MMQRGGGESQITRFTLHCPWLLSAQKLSLRRITHSMPILDSGEETEDMSKGANDVEMKVISLEDKEEAGTTSNDETMTEAEMDGDDEKKTSNEDETEVAQNEEAKDEDGVEKRNEEDDTLCEVRACALQYPAAAFSDVRSAASKHARARHASPLIDLFHPRARPSAHQ